MTKTEVEKAIQVVLNDVIDECYRYSFSTSEKNRDRIFNIVNEAEHFMDELMAEVREVKQIKGYSIDNPKIHEIRARLNQRSLDYLKQLRSL